MRGAGAEQAAADCHCSAQVTTSPNKTEGKRRDVASEPSSVPSSLCTCICIGHIKGIGAYASQVLDILSHVNKRVRGHEQIKLPLDALLDLYLADTSAPLVKNFAIVYVEMAVDRCSPEQQLAAVCSH